MLTAPPLPAVADAWIIPVLRELAGAAALDDVLRRLAADGEPSLWRAAVARGIVDDAELTARLARHAHARVADLSIVSRAALELLSERWARHFHVVPVAATDHVLEIATSAPHDLHCESALAFATGRRIVMTLASPSAIGRKLDELFPGEAPPADAPAVEVQHLGADGESAPPSELESDATAATATRLVDEVLGAGVAGGASDIHIEPDERGIAVRHRVDGMLRVVRRLPRSAAPALVSRIKILSGLDIADRLRPQDGRARVAVNGAAVDLRVSTLPATHGEKVVIRVLDGRASVRTLDSMGFNPDEQAAIDRLLEAREGLILVTGPTGSGKTTTLYAALRLLRERGVNIVTVEDPVEYRLPGIVQVQVHDRAGLTFAAALRSIMRQDPDVLLVGEIRDRETAEIAIQASLTGHLVLSTLHTNDAASAVTRLADIGIPAFKIATALKGVVAQRLLRKLCDCGRRHSPDGAPHDGRALLPIGCAECGRSGYRGRLAIVEVLAASPTIERAIVDGAPSERVAEAARAEGMRSLWESGMEHVRRGDTTLDELRRVAAAPSAPARNGSAPVGDPALGPAESRNVGDPALGPAESRNVRDPALGPAESRNVREAAPRLALDERVDSATAVDYLTRRPSAPLSLVPELPLVEIRVGTIDVFVIRPLTGGWRVLALQRANDTRCPTAWEAVHGRIESDEEPEDAAMREVAEETGLVPERLYAVAVQPFFMRPVRTVQLSIVFAAFVDDEAAVTLGPEHQAHAWLTVDQAMARFVWPSERNSMQQIVQLLGDGDAGPVEDVLRVL